MRAALLILALLTLASPAQAQNCGDGNGNNGQGIGGFNVNDHCLAAQADTQTFSNSQATANTTQAITNQNFENRFADIQTQITNNRSEARRGIAMSMAAAGLGAGAAAAAAAGPGKAALSAAAGEFQGQVSLSAGISYAVNKRLGISAGISSSPFAPVPIFGVFGSATLVLN